MVSRMSEHPTAPSGTRLRQMLRDRHWQTHQAFAREYARAAAAIDPTSTSPPPGKRQLARWLAGDVVHPHPRHCEVLEAMFPGHSAAELFQSVHGVA